MGSGRPGVNPGPTIPAGDFGHICFTLFSNLYIFIIIYLNLGKTEGKRRRGRQRMRWLDSITDSVDMNLSK